LINACLIPRHGTLPFNINESVTHVSEQMLPMCAVYTAKQKKEARQSGETDIFQYGAMPCSYCALRVLLLIS